MLVSKEKYNEVLQAFKKAEELLEEKELTIAELESSIKTQQEKSDQLAGDQKQEIETLRKENQALQLANKTNDQIIISLTNEIDDKDQRIDELEAKVEHLSNLPATRASVAVSQSDSGASTEDINHFMRNNRQDINACMNKLREEGF